MKRRSLIATGAPVLLLQILLLSSSCQRPEPPAESWHLSGADSLAVVNEVSAAIDAWTDAYNRLDAGKAIDFFDPSPGLLWAYNAVQFEHRDAVHAHITTFLSTPWDSVEVRVDKKHIIPLSHVSAELYGHYYFRAQPKAGPLVQGDGYITALLVKKESIWRVLQGQESGK